MSQTKSGLILLGRMNGVWHVIAPYSLGRYLPDEPTYHLAKGDTATVVQFLAETGRIPPHPGLPAQRELTARLIAPTGIPIGPDDAVSGAFLQALDDSLSGEEAQREVHRVTANLEFRQETGIDIARLEAGAYPGITVQSRSTIPMQWNGGRNEGLMLDCIRVDHIEALTPYLKGRDLEGRTIEALRAAADLPSFETLHARFMHHLRESGCPEPYQAALDTPEKFKRMTDNRTEDAALFGYIRQAATRVKDELYTAGRLNDDSVLKLDDFKIHPLRYYLEAARILPADAYIHTIEQHGMDSGRGPVIGYRASMLGDEHSPGQIDAVKQALHIQERATMLPAAADEDTPAVWGWCKSPQTMGHVEGMVSLAKALKDQGIGFTLLSDAQTLERAYQLGYGGGVIALEDVPTSRPVNGIPPSAETWKAREEALGRRLQTMKERFSEQPPAAFITELWPTGMNTHDPELTGFLEFARQQPQPPAVYYLGRDIPGRADAEFAADTLRRYYTRIIQLNDANLYKLSDFLPLLRDLDEGGERIVYAGFPKKPLEAGSQPPVDQRETIMVNVGSSFSSHLLAEVNEALFMSVIRALTEIKQAFPDKNVTFVLPSDDPEMRKHVIREIIRKSEPVMPPAQVAADALSSASIEQRQASLERKVGQALAEVEGGRTVSLGGNVTLLPSQHGRNYTDSLCGAAIVLCRAGFVALDAIQAGCAVLSLPVNGKGGAPSEHEIRINALAHHPDRLVTSLGGTDFDTSPDVLIALMRQAYDHARKPRTAPLRFDGITHAATLIGNDIRAMRPSQDLPCGTVVTDAACLPRHPGQQRG